MGCVCVWTIWKDVKLLPVAVLCFFCFTFIQFQCRGQERHGKSPANEDTYHRRWYQTWPVWRTCSMMITCCSGSASISISYFLQSMLENGTGLSREPYPRHFWFLFQQEPPLDCQCFYFNRNHRSTVCTGTIARFFLFAHRSKIPVRLPQSAIYFYFRTVLFDIQSELSLQVSAWELSISC